MKKKVARYVLLITTYLSLAILFTWPLATQLTTHGFGVDEDSPYHIWHNWWFKFSVFKLHQNPLFTDYIFYPQKIPLVFDANAFVFSALTLPLQLFTSVLTASNIVFIFSFALSGIGMYLLTKCVLCSCNLHGCLNRKRGQAPQLQEKSTIPDRNLFRIPGMLISDPETELAAFLAGIVYALSPYTLAQAIDGHINLTSTWFLPFYAYFLLKSLSQSRKWKYAVGAGIFTGLQALNDLTYTAFTIIFTGFVIAYFILKGIYTSRHSGKRSASRIKELLFTIYHLLFTIFPSLTIIAITSLLIFLPVLIPTIEVYRMGLKPDAPLWVQNVWSADLMAFFRPNDHSTFLRLISYSPPRGTVEGTVFVGYTVLLLALVSTIDWIRKPRNSEFRIHNSEKFGLWMGGSRRSVGLGLWIFLAASFFTFSLGPFLKIGDTWRWNILGHQLPIPLPFILLHKIPLIGGTQEPARMNPFLMLPMAILAANGVCTLYLKLHLSNAPAKEHLGGVCRPHPRGGGIGGRVEKLARMIIPTIFAFCLLFLVTFEFLQFPFPTTNLEPPPIYADIAKDPENFSVLALPVGFNSGQIALGKSPIGSLQYYQIIHQKPSFRGTVARLPAWAFDYYRDLPLFRLFIDPNRPPEPDDLDKKSVKKIFKDQLHIKYIVIHKDKFENGLEKTKNLIEEVLEVKQIEESDRTTSYILE